MTASSSLETFKNKAKNDDSIINLLRAILPEWGGKISLKSFDEFYNFRITDTCTIDYFLLGIAFSCLVNKSLLQFLQNSKNKFLCKKIEEIVNFIFINNWNEAKSIWILEILKLEPKRRVFSTFGEEYNFFISYIKEFQRLNYYCKACDEVFYKNDEMYFQYNVNSNVSFNFCEERVCTVCCSEESVLKLFEETPCWLFIQNLISKIKHKKIMFFDLPSKIVLNEKKYNLLLCTYLTGAHFKSILSYNEQLYSFDDLKEGLEKRIDKHEVSSCLYYI